MNSQSVLITFLATIPLLVWIYLLAGRGGFWLVSKHLPFEKLKHTTTKRIVAVIPARDEAAVIGRSIQSLLRQNVPILVVDDGSTDGTAEIAKASGGTSVTVLRGLPLAPGWTGKLWALSQGVSHALTLNPDYLLLTDADIQHGPNSVAELLGIAEAKQCDLVSYMVKLSRQATAEKALIPAFVFFFLMLYPPKWIASEQSKTAAAAGGCILIRPDALQRIGGLKGIQSEVIDDCALAGAVKRSGGRIWMTLTDSTKSIRSYGSFAEIYRMISRTAFSQLRHSPLLLVGTIVALFFTYMLPLVLLVTGRALPVTLGVAAWLLMSISYLPMVRFYRLSAVWSLLLPAIASFYAAATIHSAVQYWRGQGGAWKGRAQDSPAR